MASKSGKMNISMDQGVKDCVGHGWKSKVEQKKRKGNQTSGRTKGDRCQADKTARFMARRNRSWKHPEYAAWEASVRHRNGIKN